MAPLLRSLPACLAFALAATAAPLSTRQAPTAAGKANTFAIVGETGVSAQQLFFDQGTIWVVDKVQNNSLTIGGHPAWASSYDLTKNVATPMDIVTNTFCAGGSPLGNGSWVNVGGNQPITTGGAGAPVGVPNAWNDSDGGRAMRLLTPCSDGKCEWNDDNPDEMPLPRWYPAVETLPTGDVFIAGGMLYGSFVNDVAHMQNVPTYEFYPSRGEPVNSTFLADTMPANLYPLSCVLPSGEIFMLANWQAQLLNYTSGEETPLPNITHAQRNYPASGGSVMMPLTSANGFEPELWFCGGMDPGKNNWASKGSGWIISTATSTSCVSISPMDANPTWKDEEDLPEGRGMGNMILLPSGKIFVANGAGKGSAGYGWDKWAEGQSYATDPVLRPTIYDPTAAAGKRWSTNLPSSTIPRMYHSSAQLLPDGSIFIAGSSPSLDVITEANNASYPFKTEYRAEIFYPDYYDNPRPTVSGAPTSIGYGGNAFNLGLAAADVAGKNLSSVKVVLYRGGFSTHAIQMGQRQLILDNAYATNADGTVTLAVSQLPPNPAIYPPGPAMLFVVVDGVPSVATELLVGNGQIGQQPTAPATVLPAAPGTAYTPQTQTTPSAVVNTNVKPSAGAQAKKSAAAVGGVSGAVGAVPLLALAGLLLGLNEFFAV